MNGAYFYDCTQLTGNISALSNVTYVANFGNCSQLTGNISHLANLTNTASFQNCQLLTGDISALANLTFYANFTNCSQITGIIPIGCTAYIWYLDNTGLSKTDIEQSLINLDTTGHTGSGAIFDCNAGMPTITDPAALAAKASLESKGWTINVNT